MAIVTHYLDFRNTLTAPSPAPWINQDPPGTWDQLGQIIVKLPAFSFKGINYEY